MGNDRLNTTEASAGIDLEHLAKCLTSDGTLNNAYVGEHFNETPGWSTLAAEVLRLRAEARETALQYLSDTGQMSERIDELVAANAALAADNARLVKRVDEARESLQAISDAQIPDQPATSAVSEVIYVRRHVAYLRSFARAWLAGGDAQ